MREWNYFYRLINKATTETKAVVVCLRPLQIPSSKMQSRGRAQQIPLGFVNFIDSTTQLSRTNGFK